MTTDTRHDQGRATTRLLRAVTMAIILGLLAAGCSSAGEDIGDGDEGATEPAASPAVAPETPAEAPLTAATTPAATPVTAADEEAQGETTTVTLLSPVPPSVFFFPAFVGEELGFFADEGIELQYESIGEGVSMTSLLVNGRADIAAPGATEVFQGLNAGQDYDVIYDYYTQAVEGIVVPADSDVQSIEDLSGVTVGLAGDEVRSLLSFSLDTVGLSLDDVTTANVGTSGAVIANAFESGDIDAFVGGVLDFASLQVAGIELRDITPEKVGAVPGSSFAVTPRRAEELGDALPAFLRAWSKALHVGLNDPELVEEIMREVSPEEWEDPEVGAATLDVALTLQDQGPEDYGSLDKEAWQVGIEQALVAGDIEEELSTEEFLDDQYLEAANDFDRAQAEAAAESR